MRTACALGLVVLSACSKPSATVADPGREGGGPVSSAAPSAVGSAPGPALPAGATTCTSAAGGPACLRFASTEDAFRWVLGQEPAILAIGEAHAQKGTENIPSATKRFTDSLLPILENRASDVLVEAWAGDPKCQREVKAVASAQKPVQQAQAQTNPNEYLALGNRAKALGMVPDLLRPTCDDYANLADAGADTITESLGLIKRLTQAHATRLFQRNEGLKNGKVVVTYGGAMHNDLAPSDALRKYSFGPELLTTTGGRYVELDLIVPEYVKKTETWEKLAWFASWQADTGPKEKATVYRLGDKSFVLIFPTTPVPSP